MRDEWRDPAPVGMHRGHKVDSLEIYGGRGGGRTLRMRQLIAELQADGKTVTFGVTGSPRPLRFDR